MKLPFAHKYAFTAKEFLTFYRNPCDFSPPEFCAVIRIVDIISIFFIRLRKPAVGTFGQTLFRRDVDGSQIEIASPAMEWVRPYAIFFVCNEI